MGLALPLLAALTPEDYEVELCYETIEDVPFDTDAELIGISSMGHAVMRTIDIAKKFRELGKTVILGGYMVSLMPEEAKKYGDSVMIGDAEETWGEMLSDYERGELKPVYQKKLTKLETPLPRYELLLKKKIGNFLPVQAGRGCPKTCSFCSVYCLYRGQYLKRSIPDVIRDIKRVRELGFKQFLLLDDNIFSNRDYAIELCAEIAKLKMKWMTQCSIDIAKGEVVNLGYSTQVLKGIHKSDLEQMAGQAYELGVYLTKYILIEMICANTDYTEQQLKSYTLTELLSIICQANLTDKLEEISNNWDLNLYIKSIV